MRLVERIRGKFLPFAPNLLQRCFVVTVFLASFDKLGLHCVNNLLLLLSHRFAQRITFSTREVCQLTREQHHLLLIDRNTVRIFQVFLHTRNVVFDFLLSVFSGNEVWNLLHRAWTIERIHRNQVFENCWFQFPQVLLHTSRFKLERTYGLTPLIQLEGQLIVDRYIVQIDVYSFRQFHIVYSFLLLR